MLSEDLIFGPKLSVDERNKAFLELKRCLHSSEMPDYEKAKQAENYLLQHATHHGFNVLFNILRPYGEFGAN